VLDKVRSLLAVAIVVGIALFLVGCADNPPAPIVNKSTPAAADRPEVRQTATSRSDYGEELPRGLDYAVQRGDTLYSVAFRLGMDYRTLAAINDIEAPYVIQVSQRLKTVPPEQVSVATSVAPEKTAQASMSATPAKPAKTARSQPKASATAPPPSTRSSESAASAPAAKVTNVPVSAWGWPAEGKVSRGFSEERHKGIDIPGERGAPVMATAAGVVVYAGTGVTGYGALLIVKHNDTYLSAYGHNDALLVAEGTQVKSGQVIARMGSTSADSVKLHFEIRRNGRPVNPTALLPPR